MTALIITHGDRFPGANPGHTEKGFNQIRRLAPMIPDDIDLIVIGTGKRFREIYETIVDVNPQLTNVPTKSSPFCGSVDGLDIDEDGNKVVILADSTPVDLKNDYIGLSRACFLPWRFVSMFKGNILFCAGGELMIALGLRNIEKGHLYELDPETAHGKKIS